MLDSGAHPQRLTLFKVEALLSPAAQCCLLVAHGQVLLQRRPLVERTGSSKAITSLPWDSLLIQLIECEGTKPSVLTSIWDIYEEPSWLQSLLWNHLRPCCNSTAAHHPLLSPSVLTALQLLLLSAFPQ